ncbi:MAG: hypothetical protein KAJ47_04270 [Candidatus Aenigmarchaeota archaeon]|nr:hypothetical protein [Candidatus Aenigmarchaeota archaeon]
MKIELYFKNKISEYTNIYDVIKTDIIRLKTKMISPYLEKDEFEKWLKKFDNKKKGMIEFKLSLLDDLESFIPQAEELIKKCHSNEEDIYLEDLYKKAKDAKEELENLENNITRPQRLMSYIQ